MKIAYFSHAILPELKAHSIHIINQCASLNDQSANVLLYSKKGKSPSEHQQLERQYGVPINFEIKEERIYNFAFNRHIYAIKRAIHARSHSIDASFGRCLHSCFYSSVIGIPTIYETHSVPSPKGNWAKVLRKLLNQKSLLGIVVITRALKNDFCRMFNYPPEKVHVLPDAARDPKSSQTTNQNDQNRTKLNASKPIVGYVGNLYRGKGIEIIVKLPKLCPWAEFHVIGGSTSEVKEWKAQTENAPNITFHGRVAPSQVPNYIEQFNIALLPNQKTVLDCSGKDIGRWTSPLKLFEYMSHQKPIICSDLEMIKEIIENDSNGLLCEASNEYQWADSIKKIAENPNLAESLGKQARQDFEQYYSWDTRAQKIKELMKTLSN